MAQRRTDIDIAKGFAILLVVFGHLVADHDPQHVQWYEPIRRAIYTFHMPFFMYLSGYVSVYTGFLTQGRRHFVQTMWRRAKRLLLPFFALGLLILVGKLTASMFLYVDNLPKGFWPGLQGLFWTTTTSPAHSIWYLFVLFVVSLSTLWALKGDATRLPYLLGLSLLLFVLPVPAYIYANRVTTYAPFFLLGALAGQENVKWEALTERIWPLAMFILLGGLVCVALWSHDSEQKALLLPLGALSMPALHGALRHLPPGKITNYLLTLGRYCFVIYLGNTIFIGLSKALMLRVTSWNGLHFLIFAPLLMLAGIGGPILLKRQILRHIPTLDRLTN